MSECFRRPRVQPVEQLGSPVLGASAESTIQCWDALWGPGEAFVERVVEGIVCVCRVKNV